MDFSFNDVQRMLQDSTGAVWVGCHRGLLRYDPRSGRSDLLGMEEVQSAWPRTIQRIVEDPRHRLWFFGAEQVRVTDLQQHPVPDVATDALDRLAPDISDAKVGPDGRVWLATAAGVLAWDDAAHALRPAHRRRSTLRGRTGETCKGAGPGARAAWDTLG